MRPNRLVCWPRLRSRAPLGHGGPVVYRIDRVTDGDTVVLRNGQRVRLVQIDTPEVFFGVECYGPQASATAKRLLPPGTRVRLLAEPATDRVDDFGRLLRYVVRLDGVNVNLRLVALGAAAPYFYDGARGRYAARLECSRSGRGQRSSACGVRVRERATTRTRDRDSRARRIRRLRARAGLAGAECDAHAAHRNRKADVTSLVA